MSAEFLGISDYRSSEIATLDSSGKIVTAEPYLDLTVIGPDDLTKDLLIPATEGVTPLGGLAYR